MLKKLAIAISLGALAALTVAPTPAAAAAVPYNVQVKEKPAILHHNGYATGVFWLRCKQGMNAFEYNVGIVQDGVAVVAGEGPAANILPCDGTRHKVTVSLGGGLHPGPAHISVYVGIYDPVVFSDVAAEDEANIWLRYRDS